MELSSKTTGQTLEKQDYKYVIDFGVVNLNSPASDMLVLKGENLKINNVSADCSCSSGTPNVIDKNTVELEVRFKNTHISQPFNKNIHIDFTENGEQKTETINIKGQVQ